MIYKRSQGKPHAAPCYQTGHRGPPLVQQEQRGPSLRVTLLASHVVSISLIEALVHTTAYAHSQCRLRTPTPTDACRRPAAPACRRPLPCLGHRAGAVHGAPWGFPHVSLHGQEPSAPINAPKYCRKTFALPGTAWHCNACTDLTCMSSASTRTSFTRTHNAGGCCNGICKSAQHHGQLTTAVAPEPPKSSELNSQGEIC